MYNWQHKEWPKFIYNIEVVGDCASQFMLVAGEATGVAQGLSEKEQTNALIRMMMEEALKTSAIEGELLNREDVRSSIENHLGLHKKPKSIKDKRAKAIAEVMLDVRNNYNKKLSESLIKHWHKLLFEDSKTINAGMWRSSKQPMQVVSGAFGKEEIHFEAPPSSKVATEMKKFVKWYNAFKVNGNMFHAITKTSIAHLYFESIHPFEDGNGRIGRAIAEKCLSESVGRPLLISLSSVLERKRKLYYAELKKAQHTLKINDWLVYFANVILEAQKDAVKSVQQTLKRTKFFDQHKAQLNEREQKVIRKMLDTGNEGFIGGMTAKKYMSITKASKATATRDLQHLTSMKVLIPFGEGRSVHYELGV